MHGYIGYYMAATKELEGKRDKNKKQVKFKKTERGCCDGVEMEELETEKKYLPAYQRR